jgi:hypothetical protein
VNIDAAGEIQYVDRGATCNKIITQVVESLVLDSEVVILLKVNAKPAPWVKSEPSSSQFTGTYTFQLMICDFKAGALVHLIADVERVFNGLIRMQRRGSGIVLRGSNDILSCHGLWYKLLP